MYRQYRRSLERLYEDTMTVKRSVETEKPSGETVPALQIIYQDQPCRLSQKALATNRQTEAQNDILYETKAFVAPELQIRQGDVIEVTRCGVTQAYVAGEPFRYPTHQEISLQRKGYA
ncbi:DUF6093 family protein [Heliophilum fasciatum]|uniref:Uncharacterized protein n=1 Tax=Heliophilum fasciatum TaxID=35700 RepID=A0A4R2RP09_9FIRM|nr:DUF6093 family protein [Heliophilum fasciatum]MCW2277737.1 hypothetical protein [Heliophilum fasciatum]TCP64768.1 hypothetical protein EDD73_108121 [Heliophilum fasciatum]